LYTKTNVAIHNMGVDVRKMHSNKKCRLLYTKKIVTLCFVLIVNLLRSTRMGIQLISNSLERKTEIPYVLQQFHVRDSTRLLIGLGHRMGHEPWQVRVGLTTRSSTQKEGGINYIRTKNCSSFSSTVLPLDYLLLPDVSLVLLRSLALLPYPELYSSRICILNLAAPISVSFLLE
jgi:hypothetical protein